MPHGKQDRTLGIISRDPVIYFTRNPSPSASKPALNALAFSYQNELLDSYLYIGAGHFLANVRRSLFGVSRDPCV